MGVRFAIMSATALTPHHSDCHAPARFQLGRSLVRPLRVNQRPRGSGSRADFRWRDLVSPDEHPTPRVYSDKQCDTRAARD